MTECVIYCRISRDREGTGLGVERQEADCRALAAGLTVTRVFTDNDISAYSGKRRPQYEEMMALAEAGQIGVILAYSNSRLTRRPMELERLITAHERTGVVFRTVASGNDDLSTADGRMVARIKASVDAAESQRISERTKRGKQQARENGGWHGGHRSFGFAADGVTPDPGEAAIVEQICRDILDGRSMISLVRDLNDRGVTTSTGTPWTTRTLQRVLAKANPGVDEAVAAGARLVLADPSRRTTPGPARRWLLTNLMTCETCGGRLRGSASSKGAGLGTYPAYRCVTGKHVVINAVTLDEYIAEQVMMRLSLPDAERLFAAPDVDTTPWRQEAVALRVRLDALADNIDLDERTLLRRSQALRQRLDEVERQIAAATRTTHRWPASPEVTR
jgi:site-specific DNA recombinase